MINWTDTGFDQHVAIIDRGDTVAYLHVHGEGRNRFWWGIYLDEDIDEPREWGRESYFSQAKLFAEMHAYRVLETLNPAA